MIVYAIFYDNNGLYDDHQSGIMEENVYESKEQADAVCATLNAHVFIPPTLETYQECSEDYKSRNSLEECIQSCQRLHSEEDDHTYEVIPITVITS